MNRTGALRTVLVAAFMTLAACSNSKSGAPTAPTQSDASEPVGAGAAAAGDAVVADNGSTLIAVDPRTGAKKVISDNDRSVAAGGRALFGDLYGVAREADGNFVVIARFGSADSGPNDKPSRLIRVDAKTGAQALIASNAQMHYGLTSVAVGPDGGIYFGDESVADPKFNAGVVYRADPRTGALTVVTGNSKSDAVGGEHQLGAPLGLAFDQQGAMWVLADNGGSDAAPDKPNDYIGAILKVDVKTGKQTLFTSNYLSKKQNGEALFTDPRAFVRAENGDFYVVDDAALNNSKFSAADTKVVKVDHATGAESLVSDNALSKRHGGPGLLNRPYGIAIDADGRLLVDDGDRLLRVDPKTGVQSLVTEGLGNAIGLVMNADKGSGTAAAAGPTTAPKSPSSSSSAAPNQVAAPSNRWVIGFYPEYQRDLMPPAEIDWSTMTHIAVARVVPRNDGSLDKTFDYDESNGPVLARDLATRAHAHGVVPILMVGGDGTHDAFADAAAHHLPALVANLVSTMRTLGFDGLDVDWEPIQDADQEPLAALVGALRKAEPKAVITVPVGWVTTTFPTVSAFYGKLASQVDRINIMSYGMAGAWDGWKTWHSSAVDDAVDGGPSSIAVNVKSYEAAGVPASKLGVGVGFYGTCWTGGVSAPRQTIGGSTIVASDNVMSYNNIMSSYFDKASYHYDTAASAAYLGYGSPHGPQKCTFVSYEDERSIAAKGAYAVSHALGGVIVWTINQAHVRGTAGGKTDPLLAATRRAFGA